jgi:hypothetical protein
MTLSSPAPVQALLFEELPCPGSDGQLTASHRVGPDSIPGQIMCDSWSDSEHKSGSSASTSISAVNHHCTNASLPTVPEDGYTGHTKGRR